MPALTRSSTAKRGRDANALQYERMRRVIKRQDTIFGRLLRDTSRKITPEQMVELAQTIQRAQRLKEQKTKSRSKLEAFQAPEVECISKGKARQPYEFGLKVSFAVTTQMSLIVSARLFPGKSCDDDTLGEHIEQTATPTDTPIK